MTARERAQRITRFCVSRREAEDAHPHVESEIRDAERKAVEAFARKLIRRFSGFNARKIVESHLEAWLRARKEG